MSNHDLKKNIFLRYRRSISLLLVIGIFVTLLIPCLITPRKVQAEGETDDRVEEGGSIGVSDAFENILWSPIKSFGSMLQNFNYGDVINLILRNTLNKIVDRFYNQVLEEFEEKYRVQNFFTDAALPYINNGFSIFHQEVSRLAGGGMQAPLLDAFLALENLFYRGAVQTVRALDLSLFKNLNRAMEQGGAETPDSAADKLGQKGYWTALVRSVGMDVLTVTIHGAAKLEEVRSDAEAAADRDYQSSEGLNKGSGVFGLPEGGLKPIESDRVSTGSRLDLSKLKQKLASWGYRDVGASKDPTSKGEYSFAELDSYTIRKGTKVPDVLLKLNQFGYKQNLVSGLPSHVNGPGQYYIDMQKQADGSYITEVWSFYANAPAHLKYKDDKVIQTVVVYDASGAPPSEGDYTLFKSSPGGKNTLKVWAYEMDGVAHIEYDVNGLVSAIYIYRGSEPPQAVSYLTFTSRPSYDPTASGWTGLLYRPGQKVKQYMHDLINARITAASEPGASLTGLGKVLYEMMDVFTDAITFEVVEAPEGHPLEGCPIGFTAGIDDLWREMRPFDADKPSEFNCLIRAIGQIGWDTFPRLLKYIGCLAEKLLCWIFDVKPEGKDDDSGQATYNKYEMEVIKNDPQSPYEDVRKVQVDGNWEPVVDKSAGAWNSTESFLQHAAQYLVYVKLIKPHIPKNITITGVVGSIWDRIKDSFSETWQSLIEGVGSILGLAADFLEAWLWKQAIGWVLKMLGFCDDRCEERDEIAVKGQGSGPQLTCDQICAQYPDSIYIYKNTWRVSNDDYYEEFEQGEPLMPGKNQIQFKACNCTMDVAGVSTFNGTVGWEFSLESSQSAFETALSQSGRDAQTVKVPRGAGTNNRASQNPTGVAEDKWPKGTEKWIPYPGASKKEGFEINVGRDAVPRYARFHIDTKKVITSNVQDYQASLDLDLPIAALTLFDIVDPFVDDSGEFKDSDMPSMILKKKIATTAEVVHHIEPGQEYTWQFYVRNKSGLSFDLTPNPPDFYTLKGELALAPIGSKSLEVAKKCIDIVDTEVQFMHMGEFPARHEGNIAAEWKLMGYEEAFGMSWQQYKDTLAATARGDYSDLGQTGRLGPLVGLPAFDEHPPLATDPVELPSADKFWRSMGGDPYFHEMFNDSYIVRKPDGTPVTEAEAKQFAKDYIVPGLKIAVATENYKYWLAMEGAKRLFHGAQAGYKWIQKRKNGGGGVQAASIQPDYSTEAQIVQGNTTQRVLSFDHDAHPQINTHKGRFEFRVKNDASCNNEVVPFALYLTRGNDSKPLSVVPIWFQIGAPGITQTTQCNDGVDNDGDGRIDFQGYGGAPPDPGCSDANDDDETDVAPSLEFYGCRIDRDNCPSDNEDVCDPTEDNGRANPGEKIYLDVFLKNTSSDDVRTYATLSASGLEWDDATDSERFNPGIDQSDFLKFKFIIPTSYKDGDTINFNLEGREQGYDQGSVNLNTSFTFKLNSDDPCGTGAEPEPEPGYPDLQISSFRNDWDWYNEAGQRRGEVKKGEKIDLVYEVTNAGSVEAKAGWDFELSVRYPGQDNVNETFGRVTVTKDLDPGQSLVLDRSVDRDLEDFEIYFGPEDGVNQVCFGVYIDSQGGGGSNGTMTMGDVKEGETTSSPGESNNRLGFHNGSNTNVFCVPIGEEAPAADKDLEVTKASINRLQVSQGSMIVEYAYRNNSKGIGIRRDELSHTVFLKRLAADPGKQDSQTRCYENSGTVFRYDGGDTLTLNPGEERSKLYSNQYIHILPDTQYQVWVEFLDGDLQSGPDRDIDLSNNVLCSEPRLAAYASPESGSGAKRSEVAAAEEASQLDSQGGSTVSLTWKQRIQRIWAYVLSYFRR